MKKNEQKKCFFLFLICMCFLFAVNLFGNANVATFKISPSYFIPNHIGAKKILKNDKVIAFIQTRKGRVQFTPEGAYVGMIVSKMSFNERNKENKLMEKYFSYEKYEKDFVERQLVVMGIGFRDVRTKRTKSVVPILKEKTEAKVNFFVGTEENWQSNISTYKKLKYSEIWDGIDVEYIGYMDKLEYRVIVKPGGNVSSIMMSTGAQYLKIAENGDLQAKLGEATLTMTKPIAYQIISGKRVEIPVKYKILSNGNYTFEVGKYDKSQELIIDPYVEWSTLLGGKGDGVDSGRAIKVDTAGNIYVTGYTSSANFPVTGGSYNNVFNGSDEIFVIKFNPNGEIIYSTFLGGSDKDYASDIAVDNSNNVYIIGNTNSKDFPITNGAYDNTYNGGYRDVFITKLSADGSSLVYSTYLGGNNQDYGYSISVDESGNAYITGDTISNDFPVTDGAFDRTYNGNWDVFVAKINADGSFLVYSTYLGGNNQDYGYSISVDESGNAYITGDTISNDFPVTDGAFDRTYNGNWDVFVAKINADGSSLVFSTYIGGNSDESGRGIAVDNLGNAYVTGDTDSNDFPVTDGAFDRTYNGSWDVFVTKISADGSSLVYSTYLGGSSCEMGYDIAIDDSGNVYVTGCTSSEDFVLMGTNFFDRTYNGGSWDSFITKLNSDGSSLVYFTYLGGSHGDIAHGIAVDKSGNICVTGVTESYDFPVTSNAYDKTYSNFGDVFVAKLNSNCTSLIFSTYLGGNGGDFGRSMAVDDLGNVYLSGWTGSEDFPITTGVYGENLNGEYDIFVTKLNNDASSLIYSTFIGGKGEDESMSIVVDGLGNAYITGYTNSSDFPVTPGGYDRFLNGSYDVFVTKLSSDGSSLLYSTYMGGNGLDYGISLAIDESNNIYITGYTESLGFPVTNNAFQSTNKSYSDIFVTKLSADGLSLVYSTFLGGSSVDFANNIIVDRSGNAYITGRTDSMDFPVTDGAYDTTQHGEFSSDVFVTKISPDGSSLVFSTYIGGNSDESGYDIAIDDLSNVYVTGYTESRNFPTTEEAYDRDYIIGYYANSDGFVTKLSADGSSLIYSTYLGGEEIDKCYSIEVDNLGNAYVGGYTASDDFPVTEGAVKVDSEVFDAFISKLNNDGSSLIYSTYLGGNRDDKCFSIAIDNSSTVYVMGETNSSDFPVTKNYNGGSYDLFVSKFNLGTNLPLPVVNVQSKELASIKEISSGIVNPFNSELSLNFLYYDRNNALIDSKTESMPPFGKIILKSSDNLEYSQVKVVSDYPLIVYSDVETDNGRMSAYVSLDLSNELYIPHIAESTDWWDTNVFLMNNIPGDLNVLVMNNSYLLTTAGFFTTIDMENYITENPDSLKCWGKIVSDSGSTNSSGRLFTGFETFVHNGTDGAAVELQTTGYTTLFIPHIPEETDIFWTGFAFINPGENDASLTVNFYTSDGEMLGSQTITIPAKSKVSDLMKNLFPDYFGKAEWGIITSELPIIGIEIYGTQKDGICGYSLPYLAREAGILPEVINGEGLWSGIALTNVGDSVANITIQLMDKDGNVKAERQETISPRCRFKAVVSDYFEGIELEEGDYVKYDSDGSIIAIAVNGDLDRTFMTALTSSR